MSAKEFWEDDPQLFYSYRTFFINSKKREVEEWDYKCWLQGQYINDGNSKLVLSLKQFINNMFGDRKDHTEIPTYPKKPHTLLQQEKEKEKNTNKNYKNYQDSLIYFGTMKQRYIDELTNKDKKGE